MQEFDRLLAKPPREAFPEAEQADYDAVVERTSRIDYHAYDLPARYFSAMLNSPPLAAMLIRMGRLVREGQLRGYYSDAQREFVDVVLGTDFGYNGIFTVHLPDAFAVGVRPEAILAVRSGREEALNDEERLIATYARQVVSGTVTDDTHAAMTELLGTRGALEFTVFIGFLLMTIRMWQALGVPNPTDAEMDQLVAGLIDGSIPIPDPKARIG